MTLEMFVDKNPEYQYLLEEWDYVKNEKWTPQRIGAFSREKVWWYLPYDDPKTGKHWDFHWKAAPVNRTKYNCKCPYLTGHKVLPGFNDLATTHPDLVAEFSPDNTILPTEVTAGSSKFVIWEKEYEGKIYKWRREVCERAIRGRGCPQLRYVKKKG